MNMENAEELNLLKQAVNGDAAAFSALVEAYYRMIYSTAFKWVGNQTDAEDIAQEVCIKLGRAIRDFRMESKFSSWLYRITLNTAKDFQRKQRNHQPIEEVPEMFFSDGNTAEAQLEGSELWRAVQQLPEKQRDAILLVYAEGLTHGEVADVMDCKESTVSWYIHEAKKQLKIVVDDDGR